MRENVTETETCIRCGDIMTFGQEYYDTPSGIYCEDCFDFIVRRYWKRYVGDVIDRI